MKRLIVFILAFMLMSPVFLHAQSDEQQDSQNPTEYRDVEDGQLLKLVSYILMPVGKALEWGLMRPLKRASTDGSAPYLSSDINNQSQFFSHNDNASKVPPGTFGPYTINPTNNLHASNNNSTLVPIPSSGATLAPAQSIPPSSPLPSGSQPALH